MEDELMALQNKVLATSEIGEIIHCGCFRRTVVRIGENWMVMRAEDLAAFRGEFSRFLSRPCVRNAFRAGYVLPIGDDGLELDFEGVKQFFAMVDTACLLLQAEELIRDRFPVAGPEGKAVRPRFRP